MFGRLVGGVPKSTLTKKLYVLEAAKDSRKPHQNYQKLHALEFYPFVPFIRTKKIIILK